MSLTAISSLESARRKFFMNTTYVMSRMQESNAFALRRPKGVKQPLACSNRQKENFSSTRRRTCVKTRNQTFLGLGGRNESNSHYLVPTSEMKIFHELHVHHVQKGGIKRFWGQEAEISLTDISSLESARRKFFMKSTYIMSRKQGSNAFGLRRPK